MEITKDELKQKAEEFVKQFTIKDNFIGSLTFHFSFGAPKKIEVKENILVK